MAGGRATVGDAWERGAGSPPAGLPAGSSGWGRARGGVGGVPGRGRSGARAPLCRSHHGVTEGGDGSDRRRQPAPDRSRFVMRALQTSARSAAQPHRTGPLRTAPDAVARLTPRRDRMDVVPVLAPRR
ncbi:hypothetical protein; putative PE-PGRS domains [Frankia alni ACN14a]|uniref:Uncharacterized protein n=1 Tax=Frankia alni (strain DSM 45986 / CECT 9034 / ACN14a) TaxID=326424 RepID=Q0RBZ5_FRAAA|nr:hypothetical protein; putative PE-PGRS domains [Frankia alni ACN14a]